MLVYTATYVTKQRALEQPSAALLGLDKQVTDALTNHGHSPEIPNLTIVTAVGI